MTIKYTTQKVNDTTYKVFVELPEAQEFIIGVNNESEIDGLVTMTVNKTFPVLSPTYQALRQESYPPITDYLDGIVKGDQAQVQKYIDDCLAVKVKYPKS